MFAVGRPVAGRHLHVIVLGANVNELRPLLPGRHHHAFTTDGHAPDLLVKTAAGSRLDKKHDLGPGRCYAHRPQPARTHGLVTLPRLA